MKVVFKISAVKQLKLVALAAASVQEARKDAEFFNHKMVMCGDFCVSDTGYGVRQQDLTIGDDFLTYEGGRTTLVDGSLNVLGIILKVFGSLEAANTAVVKVESSAPHLKWYETEVVGLLQCSTDRLIQLATARTGVGQQAKELLFDKYSPYLNRAEVALAAQFTSDELTEFRKVRKVLC